MEVPLLLLNSDIYLLIISDTRTVFVTTTTVDIKTVGSYL